MNRMIIDFHSHAFPERIAQKALAELSHRSGGMIPFSNGTVESLVSYAKKSGVDYCVVLNIATNANQQKNVNDFAISQLSMEGVIPFGSVFPDAPDALDELERIADAGIKGIKLHPDYQNFFVDDKKYFPLYRKSAELGLITLFHSGIDIGYPKPVHCSPERMAKIIDVFEGKPVVAAHFGACQQWEEVLVHLCGKDVYFDTAVSFGRLSPKTAHELIDAHSIDKILFGSDMPWSGTDNEIRFIHSLDLPAESEEKIFSGNARKLMKI